MLKKIFAGLAGALALIAVPPTGEAERQIPIVLDLDPEADRATAVADTHDVLSLMPVALAWPLTTN